MNTDILIHMKNKPNNMGKNHPNCYTPKLKEITPIISKGNTI